MTDKTKNNYSSRYAPMNHTFVCHICGAETKEKQTNFMIVRSMPWAKPTERSIHICHKCRKMVEDFVEEQRIEHMNDEDREDFISLNEEEPSS